MANAEARRRWFDRAERKPCPTCRGQKRPEQLSRHIVQHPFVCPRCWRGWMYRCAAGPRTPVPMWSYARNLEPLHPDG